MKEEEFLRKNMDGWHKLEAYNRKLSGRSLGSLGKEEIREFADLFRLAGHNLAYSRTHYGNGKTTQYLNQMVGVSHNFFFIKKQNSLSDIMSYFTKTFPEKFRLHRKYVMAAALAFLIGAAFSLALSMSDSRYLSFIIPEEYVESIDLDASGRFVEYPVMSAYIMTNNIRVSFLAFAWGALAGIGTLLVLFQNGMLIGGILSVIVARGYDVIAFWSLILPHGFLELTAIFISGGAGLMIGKALLVPGERTRRDSVVMGAKEAAAMIPGVVVMLVLAGLIEGFFTPLDIPPVYKIVFACVTLLGICLYFRPRFYSSAKDNG